MELGLTLGSDASSTPFGFQIKSTGTNTSTTTSITAAATELGLGLGINNSNGRRRQQLSRSDHHGSTRSNGDRTVHIDPRPSLHLDLLPVTPVPRNTIHGLSWPSENANTGSSDGGSSGQIGAAGGRGFDVNRPPPAAAAEEAEAVSSPNSVASSFQMDFGIFRGSKRDSETRGGSNDGGGDPTERTSSRASDDDDNGLTRKKLRLSKEQSAFLEESFKEHNTLNPKQKLALAKQLNLRPRQVEVWFQNRRARTKLKQTEVDCEYLKRCCETLTEENRRLHKELQELRALKSSNPYYMQLPATTLTMCPSCERVATTTTTAATSSATGVTVASNISTDPSSKATAFPLSRPKFYPFSSHNQPQKSAAS